MKIGDFDIGVCSWSLHEPSLAVTIEKIKELGLSHAQLNLNPILDMDDEQAGKELSIARSSGLTLTATMLGYAGESYATIAAIRKTGGLGPDAEWPARRKRTVKAAELTRQLGVKILSTHIGFVPASNHKGYPVMLERMREISRELESRGLEMAMETGQERAGELLQFLNDLNCRNMHINFDPANMILYGAGDPIEAVRMFGRHIRHVHVKDAVGSDKPGVVWGKEVPFGAGQVGAKRFLATLREVGYRGPLVIEREGGSDRMADIRAAIEAIRSAAEK